MGRHYLIGHGERLSEPIVLPRGGATPKDIYTYEESRARLQPELHSAIANLPDDPALAPNDVHVLQMVLHPKYRKVLSSIRAAQGGRPVLGGQQAGTNHNGRRSRQRCTSV